MIKSKSVACKMCKGIVGYTHKDNNVPTLYCVNCIGGILAKLETKS